MFGRCQQALSQQFHLVVRFELFQHQGQFHRAEPGIYLRDLFFQVFPVAMTQAPGDIHLIQAPFFLQGHLVQDRIDRLFFRLVNKTAGIDYDDIVILFCAFMYHIDLIGQELPNEIDVVHESTKKDHNIVEVNTCGFIDKAKEESVNTILDQVALKKKGSLDKVYVTGCLSHRYREDLEKEIPEVDAWFGTMELPLMLKQFEADYKAELLGERLLATPRHYAYLKISEGCNRTCAFCAIPLMRGAHVSRPIEELVKEAESLVKKGVREILLIAQELTYYGLDIYKKRMLPELLHRLADVKGLEWIRLHYAYPSKFPLEILDVIRERDNICKYLDMPLQHASDNMLKAMRRQITRAEMNDLIHTIRERVPGICLRTTLIAGFPGETQQDVEELKEFLQEHRFDRVGIFTYSHEEGTSG